jgi:exosortase/archaeosortase family protein
MIVSHKLCRLNVFFPSKLHVTLKRLLLDVTDVVTFMVITVTIHILWRFWEYNLGYIPLRSAVQSLSAVLVRDICLQTFHTLRWWMGDQVTIHGHIIFFSHHGSLEIFDGCSGLKQYAQFGLLMLVWKGPLNIKCLYILAGVVMVHFINILRMVGLSLIILYRPDLWHAGHDILFKVLFYAVIFGLWMVWVEFFSYHHSIVKVVWPISSSSENNVTTY